MIALTPNSFDPGKELSAFEKDVNGAGAIVSFTGLVRPESVGGAVQALHLQAYSPMTETGISEAVEAAQNRWALTAVRVLHRTGTIAIGEPIVFVATSSMHRRAAFEAADFLMDYLKTEAVFWKKEIRADDDVWIEPRDEDYTDAARWQSDGGQIS